MTGVPRIIRFIHTIRYLRPVQIVGRVWRRLYRPRPDPRPAPLLRPAVGALVPLPARPASLIGPRRFRFLNRAGGIERGWEPPGQDRLWRYNLHYFDDLNAVGAPDRRAWHWNLLVDWVRDNPPARGTGWEPYPTSLRMVNWVKWALSGNASPGDRLPEVCLQSLAVQARWLARRLERHLLGNHLLANGKALVFAGLFFQGREAEGWLATGLGILRRELPEQVLADGGHFERSTMYHALVLEDVLDLCNLVRVYPGALMRPQRDQAADWPVLAAGMLRWLQALCHPDGEIAFFNDAAMGIAPRPEELAAYGGRLGVAAAPLPALAPASGIVALAASGYVRLEAGAAVALLDVAPVGPDYLPGHAHADTLSFELSVFGQRVVVNGGTSRYGIGLVRLRERETRAHSTVEVDGESSSEVWSGFRVARRARPFGLEVRERPESLEVACSHDGYARLRGKPIHERCWRMTGADLRVTDRVSGGGSAMGAAVARFILHPDVEIDALAGNAWVLRLGGGGRLMVSVAWGIGRMEPARYAPEFGKVLPTRCLAVELVEGRSVVAFFWGAHP